jgi:hypothetical protein
MRDMALNLAAVLKVSFYFLALSAKRQSFPLARINFPAAAPLVRKRKNLARGVNKALPAAVGRDKIAAWGGNFFPIIDPQIFGEFNFSYNLNNINYGPMVAPG